jgi:hypothetical protein
MPALTKAQLTTKIVNTITAAPRLRHAVWTDQQIADLKRGGYWPIPLRGATILVQSPDRKRDELRAMLARIDAKLAARRLADRMHRASSGHGLRGTLSFEAGYAPAVHARKVKARRTAKASRKANRRTAGR